MNPQNFRENALRAALALWAVTELWSVLRASLAILYLGDGVLAVLTAILAMDAVVMAGLAARWPRLPSLAVVGTLAVWFLARAALVLNVAGLDDPRAFLSLGLWSLVALGLCWEARAQGALPRNCPGP